MQGEGGPPVASFMQLQLTFNVPMLGGSVLSPPDGPIHSLNAAAYYRPGYFYFVRNLISLLEPGLYFLTRAGFV